MTRKAKPPELNARQRLYLLAALKIDQRQEAHHSQAFARGDLSEAQRPASEWRWMPYGRWLHLWGTPPTPLREEITRDEVDEGTGSTWAALERRGLIETQSREVRAGGVKYHLQHVKLTVKGRKLARQLAGHGPAVPKGVISPWSWKALALAWQAGEGGVPGEGGGRYGGIGWGTWLVLRNRRNGRDLVEEFVHHRETWLTAQGTYSGQDVYHIRLTEAGRAYYRERWAANHAEYPDVEAPEP
ncbi:hypothetical protein Dgeo_3045 (plasmid) [Deinococcus geothermalis DSM 11300]|uniref:Uncharacterized protein n=1 Tax=Deinococcus geothermalis (strain DSM 11300 / CIP 105573 / AG-3a) TaxID=319795 RepID=A8ZRH7_DEIGD|nr:hypothetical protein [Deinococcus geothermalis]ABW35086.1 hypothetical protein Dgeo_3045 [Deinococcus geothermalis DSM 11300]